MNNAIFDKRNWSKGRHYLFGVEPERVLCEDINIASALLCRGVQIEWNERRKKFDVIKQFQAGMFDGVEIGRDKKNNNRTVYFFVIRGSGPLLNKRRYLFHAGLHFNDSNEFRYQRERLLDALHVAKQHKAQKTYIPIVKGGGGDAAEIESHSEEGIRGDGDGVQTVETADRCGSGEGVGEAPARDETSGASGSEGNEREEVTKE